MRYRHPLYLLVLLPVLCLAALMSTARTDRATAADRLKASYIYMEAVRAINDGRFDDAVLLYDRALALDPTDLDIAAARGELIWGTGMGDTSDFVNAYEAIRDRFLANTADVENGRRWVNLAMKLHRYEDILIANREMSLAHPERTDLAMDYAWIQAIGIVDGDTAAYDSAMVILDRLEQGMGVDANLITQRVRMMALASDTAGMLSQLQRLYLSAPTNPAINLHIGRTLAAVELPDSALLYYDRACALDSTYGEAYLERAEYFMAHGDSARYDTEVFKALESPNLDFEPKFAILSNYVQALYADTSRTESTDRLFDVMTEIHPAEANLRQLYGAYLMETGRIKDGCEQFGYATDLAPDDPYNWHYLLMSASMADSTDLIISTGRAAMLRFPDNMYYPLVVSGTLLAKDDAAGALQIIDSVDLKLFSDPEQLSTYHQTRGDILYKLNKADSAFSEYETALEYNPLNTLAQNNAAYFMACENINLDRAAELIEAAVRQSPDNPTYLDTYAWVLFKRKDYPGAKLQIDLALSMYEEDDDEEGTDTVAPDSDTEDEVVEPAGADNEISAEIYDHAGDIYFMNGEPEAALQFWEKALALDPNNKSIEKKVKHRTYFFE